MAKFRKNKIKLTSNPSQAAEVVTVTREPTVKEQCHLHCRKYSKTANQKEVVIVKRSAEQPSNLDSSFLKAIESIDNGDLYHSVFRIKRNTFDTSLCCCGREYDLCANLSGSNNGGSSVMMSSCVAILAGVFYMNL